jgi:predicted ester cyclase
MTETDIREMYSRYADAINFRELDKLNDVISDHVVVNGHPVARDTVIAAISSNIEAVPDMRWELDEILIDGDRLAVRATNTGTPTKPWLGVPPSGVSFEIAEIAIYTVQNGRFVEMNFLQDSAGLLRQLRA